MKTENISYKNYSAEIKYLGAELCSLKYLENELLWQGDERFWSGQSPVLFPNVGALRGGKTIINGKEYHIPKHGIVRNREFELFEKTESSVIFVTSADEKTKALYPFDFILYVQYRLDDNGLEIKFTVENRGKETMPYCIGGHPAFNLPLDKNLRFEDYMVRFEKEENVSCPLIDLTESLIDYRNEEYHLTGDKIELEHSLFSRDALVFDELNSGYLELLPKTGCENALSIKLEFDAFPMLALWSAQGKAPFLAIEPWCGCGTLTTESDTFENKMHINFLPSVQKQSFSMFVTAKCTKNLSI